MLLICEHPCSSFAYTVERADTMQSSRCSAASFNVINMLFSCFLHSHTFAVTVVNKDRKIINDRKKKPMVKLLMVFGWWNSDILDCVYEFACDQNGWSTSLGVIRTKNDDQIYATWSITRKIRPCLSSLLSIQSIIVLFGITVMSNN